MGTTPETHVTPWDAAMAAPDVPVREGRVEGRVGAQDVCLPVSGSQRKPEPPSPQGRSPPCGREDEGLGPLTDPVAAGICCVIP